ncbi:MAG: site-2 protease family protein [Clostridia bacterium]|nr:site-2 protease family protein [Clostridia bacterium]MBR6650226.1 site-2 protease family protein [Clostridia bacterium]
MLLDLFEDFFAGKIAITDLVLNFVFVAVVVLFALSSHEAAHGYAAYKLGDPTAQRMGRLTLDPRAHLDPVGTIFMLIFGFGWAKPVPVNARYFKNPRKDMAVTAIAGPVCNLLISFISLIIYRVLLSAFGNVNFQSQFFFNIVIYTLELFSYCHFLNLYLAIFNLIPIPPLDGSRLMFIFLPDKYYFGLMRYERYIKILFFILLYMGIISGPLSFVAGKVSDLMGFIVGLVPGL